MTMRKNELTVRNVYVPKIILETPDEEKNVSCPLRSCSISSGDSENLENSSKQENFVGKQNSNGKEIGERLKDSSEESSMSIRQNRVDRRRFSLKYIKDQHPYIFRNTENFLTCESDENFMDADQTIADESILAVKEGITKHYSLLRQDRSSDMSDMSVQRNTATDNNHDAVKTNKSTNENPRLVTQSFENQEGQCPSTFPIQCGHTTNKNEELIRINKSTNPGIVFESLGNQVGRYALSPTVSLSTILPANTFPSRKLSRQCSLPLETKAFRRSADLRTLKKGIDQTKVQINKTNPDERFVPERINKAVKVDASRTFVDETKMGRCSLTRLNNHQSGRLIDKEDSLDDYGETSNENVKNECSERTAERWQDIDNEEILKSNLVENRCFFANAGCWKNGNVETKSRGKSRWDGDACGSTLNDNKKRYTSGKATFDNDTDLHRIQINTKHVINTNSSDKNMPFKDQYKQFFFTEKPDYLKKEETKNTVNPKLKLLDVPTEQRRRTRHYSLSRLSNQAKESPESISAGSASIFRSVRCPHSSGYPDVVLLNTADTNSTTEHVEIDAGTPPPVDDSLFYDNLDTLREARRINDKNLMSTMWSSITESEMKILLEMEKKNSLSGIPEGERIRHIAYHWACYRGLDNLILKLEQSGVNPNYHDPTTGMNALLAASLGGRTICIQHLVKNGADTNCTNTFNNYTALHFALYGNSVEAVKLLLSNGAKPNLYGSQDKVEPVLHCAIRSEAIEIVKLLLDQGASVVEKNHVGETPLHVACFVQSLPCVELLLANPGTNINAVDRAHRTPLHFAVMTTRSSAKLVELLLKNRAFINAADRTGFTPLHIAALNEQSHCVDSLIWAGADVSATTNSGLSALNVIVRKIPESLQVFRQRLDASISLTRPVPQNREFEMRLHFDLLFPSNNQCETSFINTFVQEHRKDLLSHPLVKAFLHLKWEKIRKLYLLRILLYAMTVIFMTTYVLTALAYKCYNNDEVNNSKICGNKRISGFLFRKPVIEIQWYFALILTCITIPRKIFGFMVYKSAKQYFSSIDNVLDGIVILSVFVTSFVYTGRTYDWQNYVGAFAILCAWTNLMLMVGQLPAFGTYVAMFTHIQFEFAKLLLAYSGLLIGFTISFCVIFVGEPSFGNPFTGLIKVLAMMAGELDFEGLINPTDDESDNPFMIYHPLSVCSQILFTLFIVFVTVILMNLLVGIAVHDIQGLRNHAGLTKLVRQTKLILFTEMVLHNSSIPYAFRKWMSDHKIDVEYRKRVLVVKPLNPLEKRLPKDILKSAYEIAQKNIPFTDDDSVSLIDHVSWMKQQTEESSDSNLQSAIENLAMKIQQQEETIKSLREQLLDTNGILETIVTKLSKEKSV